MHSEYDKYAQIIYMNINKKSIETSVFYYPEFRILYSIDVIC